MKKIMLVCLALCLSLAFAQNAFERITVENPVVAGEINFQELAPTNPLLVGTNEVKISTQTNDPFPGAHNGDTMEIAREGVVCAKFSKSFNRWYLTSNGASCSNGIIGYALKRGMSGYERFITAKPGLKNDTGYRFSNWYGRHVYFTW